MTKLLRHDALWMCFFSLLGLTAVLFLILWTFSYYVLAAATPLSNLAETSRRQAHKGEPNRTRPDLAQTGNAAASSLAAPKIPLRLCALA
ncbi:MAG: hypothetical protein ACP5HG_12225 [Anaerolineae bacterium]